MRVLMKNIVRIKNNPSLPAMPNMSNLPLILTPVSISELVLSLDLLPSYDPDRFESLDGYDNPNCTNKMRAGFTTEALDIYEQTCVMNEEPDVAISDLIADLLHLVHSSGYSPKEVLEKALTNFIAEAG